MKQTTLGYLEYNGSYLMLFRNKKKNDVNAGKWIGVGGHFEAGETAEECFLREVYEETGITLKNYIKRGIIDFVCPPYDEQMHLFTAKVDNPDFKECNEGTLKWVPIEEIMNLNLWEGDRVFLKRLIAGDMNINLRLEYENDILVSVVEK